VDSAAWLKEYKYDILPVEVLEHEILPVKAYKLKPTHWQYTYIYNTLLFGPGSYSNPVNALSKFFPSDHHNLA
jgi:hypothetical protein